MAGVSIVSCKGFALTWYRALSWYSSPSRQFAAPCRDGRSATRYRAARETLPRVPTAFQGSNSVRGGSSRGRYQVKARYQVRANPLLQVRFFDMSYIAVPLIPSRVDSHPYFSTPTNSVVRLNQPHAVSHNICGLCVPIRRCPVVSLSLRLKTGVGTR